MGSRDHSPRKAWYKPVGAKSKPAPREKSEGATLPSMVRTTEPHRREGPLLQRGRAGRDVMVHARQSQPHPGEKSRALQRGLYRAAKRSGTRRFHALYDRIVRPDVLWRAWLEVRANRGRAGVDGVRIEDVERLGAAAYLEALAAELKAGVYRPQPVLRVGDSEAGWPHTPSGHPDGSGPRRPAGVQNRHRAAL